MAEVKMQYGQLECGFFSYNGKLYFAFPHGKYSFPCVYYARYHLVLATKYRRKIFQPGIKEYLFELLKRVPRYYPEIRFVQLNGEADHLHLLVSIPPKISVSQAVNIIKVNTAREIRKKFKFLDKVYWGNSGIWSNGYFVSTVGVNEEIIRKYVERQRQADIGQKIVIG